MTIRFRDLPSVGTILSDIRVKKLVDEFSHEAIIYQIRAQLEKARSDIYVGCSAPGVEEIIQDIQNYVLAKWSRSPRAVINATGVILHTNLGRAPLSSEAIESIKEAASGYTDLEIEIDVGKRGTREANVISLLCQLTGSESAYVVNNATSALLLGLGSVATGKEVIVSRGELVEIGGGVRIPEILRQSGVTLVEVGTTNRTYKTDFEAALSENTGAILVTHSSNFRISGFTCSPTLLELVHLGTANKIPVLHDIGSGCLLDTVGFGLAHEPMPQASISAGINMVVFSGDKLLGGPQAGVIIGDIELVKRVRSHPLARAMRIDKLSLASLNATLLHYLKEEAVQKIPLWKMIVEKAEDLHDRANRIAGLIGPLARVVVGVSTIGGGSLPGDTLPTFLISLCCNGGVDANEVALRLRQCNLPVIARIDNDEVILDLRTVFHEQELALIESARLAISSQD